MTQMPVGQVAILRQRP